MINALEELLDVLTQCHHTREDIEIIHITCYRRIDKEILQIDNINLSELDFDYYCGYGGQELFGKVLFKDGHWLERGEYDGSEWWNYYRPLTRDSIIRYNDEMIR